MLTMDVVRTRRTRCSNGCVKGRDGRFYKSSQTVVGGTIVDLSGGIAKHYVLCNVCGGTGFIEESYTTKVY